MNRHDNAQAAPALSFRLATHDDALCVGALGTQVFYTTYAPDGIIPVLAKEALQFFSTEAIEAEIARPGTFLVLAECNGYLVGYAHVTMDTAHEHVPEARAPAEVYRLYVQERFTGRGVGRALLADVEARVAALGADVLWMHTWIGNIRARAFYPRCGYVERGVTHYVFQGVAYENRLFAKPLTVAAGSGVSPG